MIKALKRLNEALPGLLLGIAVYGLLVQFIGMWFVSDKLHYTTGLWVGIALLPVRVGESGTRRLSFKSVLRYLVVVLVFFVMMYFHLGNLVSAFIGVLGLKVSAYVQPFMHKMIFKDIAPEESTNEQEEEVKL